MEIVYLILIYLVVSTAITSVLFYKKYKNDVELRGLHWTAYVFAGAIYGWITAPLYISVVFVEYIGGWVEKGIEKTLTHFPKNK